MTQVPLSLGHVRCIAVFVTVILGKSLFAQQVQSTPSITTTTQSPTAAPLSQPSPAASAPTPASELVNVETKVRRAVIWLPTFDPKGNLLRTETGSMLSADGPTAMTAHALDGAVNAVAKTADG